MIHIIATKYNIVDQIILSLVSVSMLVAYAAIYRNFGRVFMQSVFLRQKYFF